MIILSDLNRYRVLMPVSDQQWLRPSVTESSYQHTFFGLHAYTHDGVKVWSGYYDDRRDFDACVMAVAQGNLHTMKPLWSLSTPSWHDGLTGFSYQFLTYVALTTASTANQSWSVPVDFTSSNTIYAIGGGAGGDCTANVGSTAGDGCGGGGGAMAKIVNQTLSGSITYRVSPGGAGVVVSSDGTITSNPTNGGPAWFNGASSAAATLYADFGQVGEPGTNLGVGGHSSQCTGSSAASGGNGRYPANIIGLGDVGAGGGGGSATLGGVAGFNGGEGHGTNDGGFGGGGGGGQFSAGSSSPTPSSSIFYGGNGGNGSGSSGFGPAGGSSQGNVMTGGNGSSGGGGGGGGGNYGSISGSITPYAGAGGAGSVYQEVSTYGGSGGGGGAGTGYFIALAGVSTTYKGGAGGTYGGGGGAGAFSISSAGTTQAYCNGGNGGQALILVSYTASVTVTALPQDLSIGHILYGSKTVGY